MNLDKRSRALATIMALAILLVLPLPDFSAPLDRMLVILLIWLGCIALAAVCYFKKDWITIVWAAFTVTTVFQLLIFRNPVTLALSVVWKLWLNVRVKRIQLEEKAKKLGVALLVLTAGWASPARAAEIPDSMKGRKIEEVASCGVVDQIPWIFRKGKRQSRFIIRDKLRLTTQPDFSIWEIHQVLDSGGYVAYVFKRIRDDGIMEAIVTKESSYNRILEKGKNRKIAEVRSLKTLIDRPVLNFVSPEGGSVVFLPSLGGLARLQINFSGGRNRLVPPLLLVGRSCERVEDPDTKKSAEGAAAAPTTAAPAAGGAAAP